MDRDVILEALRNAFPLLVEVLTEERGQTVPQNCIRVPGYELQALLERNNDAALVEVSEFVLEKDVHLVDLYLLADLIRGSRKTKDPPDAVPPPIH